MKEVTKAIIRADTVQSFFDRARKAAKKADRGEPFKKSATLSFEDRKEALKALSETHRHSLGKRPYQA